MAKVGRETQRLVQSVEDALAHYSIDGDNVAVALEALHELLETEIVVLFSLTQRAGGSEDLMVAREASVGLEAVWRETFDRLLEGRGVSWGAYNAVRPEPDQRDVVLRSDEIATLTNGRGVGFQNAILSQLGLLGTDSMRVLICEGPSMLASVGLLQAEQTTERQRELLTRVIPAFRRRLEFERFITEAKLAASALITALEQVNGAAYVLGSAGHISHANAAGRARFDNDPRATRTALDACVAGAANPRFKVAPLRNAEGGAGHIVIELPEPTGGAEGLAATARHFGLTPAQGRVLERVAHGSSNATIAADLGVAERTIEAHVTAILNKAQVPSRAALIVRVFKHRQSA